MGGQATDRRPRASIDQKTQFIAEWRRCSGSKSYVGHGFHAASRLGTELYLDEAFQPSSLLPNSPSVLPFVKSNCLSVGKESSL